MINACACVFSRFAALLEPGWYILPPGLFDALKLKICVKFGDMQILLYLCGRKVKFLYL